MAGYFDLNLQNFATQVDAFDAVTNSLIDTDPTLSADVQKIEHDTSGTAAAWQDYVKFLGDLEQKKAASGQGLISQAIDSFVGSALHGLEDPNLSPDQQNTLETDYKTLIDDAASGNSAQFTTDLLSFEAQVAVEGNGSPEAMSMFDDLINFATGVASDFGLSLTIPAASVGAPSYNTLDVLKHVETALQTPGSSNAVLAMSMLQEYENHDFTSFDQNAAKLMGATSTTTA